VGARQHDLERRRGEHGRLLAVLGQAHQRGVVADGVDVHVVDFEVAERARGERFDGIRPCRGERLAQQRPARAVQKNVGRVSAEPGELAARLRRERVIQRLMVHRVPVAAGDGRLHRAVAVERGPEGAIADRAQPGRRRLGRDWP
jgi:hypothetical protein